MSLGRKIALGAGAVIFLAAKIFFAVKTPKAIGLASLPALILILSSPVSTSATDIRR